MSYTALYRKFRPSAFEDVKGQDPIVVTLKNQILTDKIGHAYLFCGTRGTGKTSVAKIFAKSVNCEHPKDGSPCGICDSCRAISEGRSMNVVEIDAASNNSVENIRKIIEEVEYRPTQGKYRVYIIDEVHMLSTGAFNALLKTLEEPPEYVIFILATTEIHKIPVTILSRCQRYDFKRMTVETLVERLKELMEEEGLKGEEQALVYLSRKADGSMRDSLSLLDQCLAFYPGEILTYNHVLEVLGAVDTDVFRELTDGLIEKNTGKVLDIIEELVMGGRELSALVQDYIWYLRNLLLIKSAPGHEIGIDGTEEQIFHLQEEAKAIEYDMLVRYIANLSELSGQLRYATQKRVLLEVALIKLCNPAMETNSDSLLDRLRALEKKVEKGVVRTVSTPKVQEDVPMKKKVPKAVPEEVKLVVQRFPQIIGKTSGALRTYLKRVEPSMDENGKLLLVTEDELGKELLSTENHLRELQEILEETIGKSVEVRIQALPKGEQFEDVFVNLREMITIPIEIED